MKSAADPVPNILFAAHIDGHINPSAIHEAIVLNIYVSELCHMQLLVKYCFTRRNEI